MSRLSKAITVFLSAVMIIGSVSYAGQWRTASLGYYGDIIQYWYQDDDGGYPRNEWRLIDGSWYYFDGDGYMMHDCWIQNMYYMGENGAMISGTITPDGFYVDESGRYVPGSGNRIDGEYVLSHIDAYSYDGSYKQLKRNSTCQITRQNDQCIKAKTITEGYSDDGTYIRRQGENRYSGEYDQEVSIWFSGNYLVMSSDGADPMDWYYVKVS